MTKPKLSKSSRKLLREPVFVKDGVHGYHPASIVLGLKYDNHDEHDCEATEEAQRRRHAFFIEEDGVKKILVEWDSTKFSEYVPVASIDWINGKWYDDSQVRENCSKSDISKDESNKNSIDGKRRSTRCSNNSGTNVQTSVSKAINVSSKGRNASKEETKTRERSKRKANKTYVEENSITSDDNSDDQDYLISSATIDNDATHNNKNGTSTRTKTATKTPMRSQRNYTKNRFEDSSSTDTYRDDQENSIDSATIRTDRRPIQSRFVNVHHRPAEVTLQRNKRRIVRNQENVDTHRQENRKRPLNGSVTKPSQFKVTLHSSTNGKTTNVSDSEFSTTFNDRYKNKNVSESSKATISTEPRLEKVTDYNSNQCTASSIRFKRTSPTSSPEPVKKRVFKQSTKQLTEPSKMTTVNFSNKQPIQSPLNPVTETTKEPQRHLQPSGHIASDQLSSIGFYDKYDLIKIRKPRKLSDQSFPTINGKVHMDHLNSKQTSNIRKNGHKFTSSSSTLHLESKSSRKRPLSAPEPKTFNLNEQDNAKTQQSKAESQSSSGQPILENNLLYTTEANADDKLPLLLDESAIKNSDRNLNSQSLSDDVDPASTVVTEKNGTLLPTSNGTMPAKDCKDTASTRGVPFAENIVELPLGQVSQKDAPENPESLKLDHRKSQSISSSDSFMSDTANLLADFSSGVSVAATLQVPISHIMKDRNISLFLKDVFEEEDKDLNDGTINGARPRNNNNCLVPRTLQKSDPKIGNGFKTHSSKRSSQFGTKFKLYQNDSTFTNRNLGFTVTSKAQRKSADTIHEKWSAPNALRVPTRSNLTYYWCGSSLFYGKLRHTNNLYQYCCHSMFFDAILQKTIVERDVLYLTKKQIRDGIAKSLFVRL